MAPVKLLRGTNPANEVPVDQGALGGAQEAEAEPEASGRSRLRDDGGVLGADAETKGREGGTVCAGGSGVRRSAATGQAAGEKGNPVTHPYRASPPPGSLQRPRRVPWLLIVCVLSVTFMAGAGVVNSRHRDSRKRAMPLVCKAEPRDVLGGSVPNQCWDGEQHRYLMPGYGEVYLEGGRYLVGWPK